MKRTDPTDRELARETALAESRERIVEAARRWYRYGNEAELSAAVQDHEVLLKPELDQPEGEDAS